MLIPRSRLPETQAADTRAKRNKREAYDGLDFVIIATPADYASESNTFNTKSVEAAVCDVLAINPQAVMVKKSTVPVGYTAKLWARLGCENSSSRQSSCASAASFATTSTSRASSLANARRGPRPSPGC